MPANPLLFRYAAVLCAIYAGTAMGAFLLLLHEQAGYCLYGAALMVYNAALPVVRFSNTIVLLFIAGVLSVLCRSVRQGLTPHPGMCILNIS